MTTQTRQLKNAPLPMPADREAFVRWAIAKSDEIVSAGYQPLQTGLSREPGAQRNGNPTAAASDPAKT